MTGRAPVRPTKKLHREAGYLNQRMNRSHRQTTMDGESLPVTRLSLGFIAVLATNYGMRTNVKRILYLLAMYTGARAVFNRARSFSLPGLRAAILDGETLQIDESNLVRIRVNARPSPKILGSENNAGMISIHLISPGISRLSYALLRLTSHFGCGHVEIAFYETHDSVTCFAIRNILRSNIDRLRLGKMFRNLKLSSDKDEIVLLQKILQELNARGVRACLASPEECVSLSVNKSLLKPENYDRVIEALTRRYRRIMKRIAMDNNMLHTESRVARILKKNRSPRPGEHGLYSDN